MQRIDKSQKRWWKQEYHGSIYRFSDGEVVCNDALNLLDLLKDQVADIVFLDPPFNLGKRYGSRSKGHDRIDELAYEAYMSEVIQRSIEILKPGGSLFLYHIPKWAIRFGYLLQEKGLLFRHWIAVGMKNGFVSRNYLHPAHYALLYYTKGSPTSFNRPKVPLAKCRHCNKEIKDYGGYKKFVEDGLNLSDFWDDLSPVRHKKFKHRKGNELPPKLVERALTISCVSRGLVIDPFAGTGSVLAAARKSGMRFVGGDIEIEFLEVIAKRLQTSRGPISIAERRKE